MSRRLAFLWYGGIAYWSFVMAILYLVGFIGNILVPRSIDVGPEVPSGLAATIDLALIVLFAVQHSVMARPGFKKWWTNKIPEPIERSTFVFFTTSVFGLMFWFWRPIPVIVWHVDEQTAALALDGLFWLGWVIALVSTFLISHFDLFGIRQVRVASKGIPYEAPRFTASSLYRYVRHPINLGFLIAIWATPHMTVGHLIFSVSMTIYIIGATILEERDLIDVHGDEYRAYRKKVPMLIPFRLR